MIYIEKYDFIVYNNFEVKKMEQNKNSKEPNFDFSLSHPNLTAFHIYLESFDYTAKERMKIIGEKLEYLRTESHMTQRDICNILNISPQTYSGYESGKHEPSVETLIRLSYFYNVSLDDLCCKHDLENLSEEDNRESYMIGNSNVFQLREAMDKFKAQTEAKMQEMQKQIEQLNNK